MKENKTVSHQRRILAKNIKKLLGSKGKTQTDMARELGIAETTVSSWMNCDRYPRIDKIQQMADYFGVYRSDITEDKENKPVITSTQYRYFPTSISAGLPLEVDGITDNNVEEISIPDSIMGKWAGRSDIFIMRINGDSMNKIMPHNSLIAVKPVQLSELKNDDIVVYSDGGDYAVKRFYQRGNEVAFKPDSTDVMFSEYRTTIDNEDLKIHGKVVLYIVELD